MFVAMSFNALPCKIAHSAPFETFVITVAVIVAIVAVAKMN